SGFQRILDKFPLFETGENNNLYLRELLADGARGCRSVHHRQSHIHEYYVWQDLGTELDGSFAVFSFAYQLQIIKNLKEGCQSPANHRMIINEHDPDRFGERSHHKFLLAQHPGGGWGFTPPEGEFSTLPELACDRQECAHGFGAFAHHIQAIMTGGGLFRIKPPAIIAYT